MKIEKKTYPRNLRNC